jgi:hypothetical protein
MQLPVEQTQAEAERIIKNRSRRPQTVMSGRGRSGPVVVERRAARRKHA